MVAYRMKLNIFIICLPIALLAPSTVHANSGLLWQIGKDDNDTSEFRDGPNGYAAYSTDACYIISRSSPKQDWPYAQPGPDDHWAGADRHTFTVFFTLKSVSSSDQCCLLFDLVDTHSVNPPALQININGRHYNHLPPKGASDASIFGDPSAGKEHCFSIDFPASHLREGLNEITITTLSGSWILYDWLGLETPTSVKLAECSGTLLRSVRIDSFADRENDRLVQRMWLDLMQIGEPEAQTLVVTGLPPRPLKLRQGEQTIEVALPIAKSVETVSVEIHTDSKTVAKNTVTRGPAKERQPADWVDPFLGTATSRWMLYPGPSTPFGMVKLSPDNQQQQWKAGYEYLIENIAGFSHLHSWTMGGLLVMPTTGPLKVKPGSEREPDKGYRSRFSHNNEIASPGYYGVTLDDYDIKAELTSTTRTGFMRFTFPRTEDARILFDLETPTEYGYTVLDAKITKVSDNEIEGYSRQRSGRYASWNEFTLHFVARFDKPFKSMGCWLGDEIRQHTDSITGKGDIGAFLNFATEEGEIIRVKTGISLVSIAQARLNLDVETSAFAWDFDRARGAARQTWNNLLGKIEVYGGTYADRVKFYTNLYRSYCARTILSDVNGKYVDMYEKVQHLADPDSPVFGCDAFWNTFWNLNQLWNLATPDITSKWVRSLLEIHDKGGWLPKGPAGLEYSSIMVASHEIALIVAAYQAGIRDYDIEKAYEAIRHVQMTPGRPHPGGGHVGNRQLAPYMELGYVPIEKGPVSNTLEYAYDDWCVAQMAKALGKNDDYKYFMKRAANYKNVFDPSVGYMRQRHTDGSWVKDFSPYSPKGFVEGNAWQYTFFVPQDVHGLIDLIGLDEFNDRLDEGFVKSRRSAFNATGDNFAVYPINHGNQPNMQAAYLFNYSRKPCLTQKWAREIMNRYYGTGPVNGYPGDEDQGQMGSWYVMSAIGLFQMDGGCSTTPIYEIGSPLFDRIVIHLDQFYYPDKSFVIETENNSPDNVYVQSATLDGKPLNKPWFYHSELVDGGILKLKMGPQPNVKWGIEDGLCQTGVWKKSAFRFLRRTFQ
ncbi:MAG: GH92 family glycosyl hydrolase [Planctomycetes bacterium]|nr:GH92 family glycosyl hydrolase [Planctomycetota bacterium]